MPDTPSSAPASADEPGAGGDDDGAGEVAAPSADDAGSGLDVPGAVPAEQGRTQRRARVLAAALAVATIVVLVLALLAASLWGRLSEERSERAEVSRVAGTMAAALLTYDYEDLDQARERVLSLSTGKFRTEYRSAFEGLRTLLSEAKASSRGTVTDVFLHLEEGEPTASAIVVVNTVAEGTAGRRATVASYIQLDLVKVEGEWKVDGVTNLNFGSAPVDLGGRAEPPATTPPGER